MTDATIVAIVGAVVACVGIIPATIAAVAALRAAKKTDTIDAKVEGVKQQVDGNLSRVTNALAVEQEATKGHLATIAAMTAASGAAQALAIKQAEPPPPTKQPS